MKTIFLWITNLTIKFLNQSDFSIIIGILKIIARIWKVYSKKDAEQPTISESVSSFSTHYIFTIISRIFKEWLIW